MRTSENWVPDKSGSHVYTLTPDTVGTYKQLLTLWGDKSNSVSKFVFNWKDKYKRVGAHGFHTWADSRAVCIHPITKQPCDGVDILEFYRCADKGGPGWVTKELENYSAKGYIHSHHPSTAWRLLRGEILAYNYIHILMDAVYTLRIDISTSDISVLQTSK